MTSPLYVCVFTLESNKNSDFIVILFYIDDAKIVLKMIEINDKMINRISKHFKLKRLNTDRFLGYLVLYVDRRI